MQQASSRADHSIAGEIAETLAGRIVSGEIAPGSWLRQDHVAAAFASSHVPVREAFRRLEARGLVSREPRRGVRVPPLEPAVIAEVTEMRAALECLALRHAMATGLAAADLAVAEAAIAEAEASGRPQIWETANRRFHGALVRACAMPRLLATLDDLQAAGARFLLATWRGLDWEARSEAEHRALLAAVRRGDVEAATGLLARHVLAAGAALRAAVEAG